MNSIPLVRLRFSTEPWSLTSALIRWRTMCKQSHVEFELANGLTFGARFSLRGKIGRYFGIRAWSLLDGVQWRGQDANKHQQRIIHATFPGIEKAYTWAVNHKAQCPYDVKAILGIITSRGWACQDSEFCSDLIAQAAEETGVRLLDNSAWATTPRDLLISPLVHIEERQS